MWHKPCRTFNLWCLCIKTRCLLDTELAPGCYISPWSVSIAQEATQIMALHHVVCYWLKTAWIGDGISNHFQLQMRKTCQSITTQFHWSNKTFPSPHTNELFHSRQIQKVRPRQNVTRRSENDSTLGWPGSENANISRVWPFHTVIRFMVNCIMPPNFRLLCDFFNFILLAQGYHGKFESSVEHAKIGWAQPFYIAICSRYCASSH